MTRYSDSALRRIKRKGSYLRKGKHAKRGNWEASGKQANRLFTTGLPALSF